MNADYKMLVDFLDENQETFHTGFMTNQASTFLFKKLALVILPDQVLVQYHNETDERRAFEQKIIKAATSKAIMNAIHADGTVSDVPLDIAVYSHCGNTFCLFHQEDNTVFTPMESAKPIEMFYKDRDSLYRICYDLIFLASDLYYRFSPSNNTKLISKQTTQEKVDETAFFDPTTLTSEVRPS